MSHDLSPYDTRDVTMGEGIDDVNVLLGSDAGRFHGVDEETAEPSALQKVKCMDGGAPW